MIGRIFGDRRRGSRILRRDRSPRRGCSALVMAQALVAARLVRHRRSWLAVAIAAQLALGGTGGRVRHRSGPLATRVWRATRCPRSPASRRRCFGRLIPGGLSVLLVPILAVLLWSVTYLELRLARGTGGRTDPATSCSPGSSSPARGRLLGCSARRHGRRPILLVAILAVPLAIRAAEARGRWGRRRSDRRCSRPGRRPGRARGVAAQRPAPADGRDHRAWPSTRGAAPSTRFAATRRGRAVAAEFGSPDADRRWSPGCFLTRP